MGDGVELVALYWTVSGPVEPHGDREWSLFDLRDRCEQAARAGFKGIGIWHADLEHVLETRTLQDVRTLMDDNGLRYLELECLLDWFLEPGPERTESDRNRKLLLEAAEVLPAHHLKAANIFSRPCELPRLVEAYAELCAEAAQHTDAPVVFEFMPPDVNVHDVETALKVVEGAGADNGGLAIDTWHMAKLGIQPDDLRAIPLRWLKWVELSDGQYEDMPDPVAETTRFRRLPGEGEFPIRDYVRVCREVGYEGPWGVEVLSDALRELPIDQIFDRAYETSLAQFVPEEERSASV